VQQYPLALLLRSDNVCCSERFDLVHLGLGPDGHTASLVPGDPALDVTDQFVATTGAYQGRRRKTLTYPTLARAGQILWLVTGEDKKTPLAQLVAGDRSIPAGRSGLHTRWYSPTRQRPESARTRRITRRAGYGKSDDPGMVGASDTRTIGAARDHERTARNTRLRYQRICYVATGK
jgi:hypothetical protein